MKFFFLFLSLILVVNIARADDKPCGLIDVTINGTSLAPLYNSGDHVDAMTPQCLGRDIVRNDIVIFKSGASELPLIKRVVAMPGDRFAFRDNQLFVNDAPSVNSEDNAFRVSDASGKLLKLYEDQFNNTLPHDVFLVMGDHDGVLDSSRIGPVAKQDILYVATGAP